jgi:hypothetical protein
MSTLYFYMDKLNMKSKSLLFFKDSVEMGLTRCGANPRKATLDQVKDCDINMLRPLPNFDSLRLIHIYIITYETDI